MNEVFMDNEEGSSVKSNKWLLNKEGGFYTPFFTGPRSYYYAGAGHVKATPKELVEELNRTQSSDVDYYDSNSGHFYKKLDNTNGVLLPSGVYQYLEDKYPEPERLFPIELRSDNYVVLNDMYDELKEEVERFFKDEKIYRDLKIIYKKGILAYGDPGEGKSAFIRELLKTGLPENSVVMFMNTLPTIEFLKKIKYSLADRMKVLVIEEITSQLTDADDVEKMLTFLDGEMSPDKCLVIATTNYPEDLPGNIVDRPSRFDKLIEFGNPNIVSIGKLTMAFLNTDLDEETKKKFVGFSTAFIKEICIQHLSTGKPLDELIKGMKKRRELIKKAFKKGEKLGI